MRSQIEDEIHDVSSAFVVHAPVELLIDPEEGRTRQEFAEDCDINVIMSRYEKTGVINHFSPRSLDYVDFSEIPDNLQDALQMLEDAKASFMTLPASVRTTFDNDPLRFVAFASDPKNLDKMREWGLAPVPEPDPAPAPAPSPEPVSPT